MRHIRGQLTGLLELEQYQLMDFVQVNLLIPIQNVHRPSDSCPRFTPSFWFLYKMYAVMPSLWFLSKAYAVLGIL